MNKKLTAIVESHVARRLKTLDADVDALVDEFVDARIEQLLDVVFGVDSRWGRLEAARDFASHPIGAVLTDAAMVKARLLVEEIVSDKVLVTDKMMASWRRVYRETYAHSVDERVRKMMRDRAGSDARDDVEDLFTKALASAMEAVDD